MTEPLYCVKVANMANDRVTVHITDLLPPVKAAAYLNITTMTLWRWNRDGYITCVMLDHPYYHINELDRVKALQDGKK